MTATNELTIREWANQYLTFILGGEEYGIDILSVQEIRGWEPATVLPNTPDYMLGVINLRGNVVPVVDLRKRFSLAKAEFGHTTVVIVVKVAEESGMERIVGLVVDAISDVYNIPKEDVCDAADLGGVIAAEYLAGLATVDENMIILLNVDLLVTKAVLAINVNQEPFDAE